jgi:RNA polymerase sigma-70 factor (ECF subfamily)
LKFAPSWKFLGTADLSATTDDRDRFDAVVREHSGRILASLIGQYRDLQLAEDSLQEAWLLAAERWPVSGWPDNPPGWVYTVAGRQALDRIRRERGRKQRYESTHRIQHDRELDDLERQEERWHSGVDDDRLRLLFTCCHPILDVEARVALTLRSVAWLSTDEIAAAFGISTATMAQRIVRAKKRIKAEGVPYRVPVGHELPDRIAGVLRVVYLVFNEAYLSSRPDEPIRTDLANEATRLGRQIVDLMPDESEAAGLLALMLAQHSRSAGRFDSAGDMVLLEHQDRSLWDALMIEEASKVLQRALRRSAVGQYQLQAAIAALHSEAPTWRSTDWAEIAALYEMLARIDPGPVVALNRAVATGFADGPAAGLAALAQLEGQRIPHPHLLHAARAEFFERNGDLELAIENFDAALTLVDSDAQRRHLERRRAALT